MHALRCACLAGIEMYADYSQGESLDHSIILSCHGLAVVRVSTVAFPYKREYGGRGDCLIETWIFSDFQGFNSKQIFHKSREAALRVHKSIANNLRLIFAEYRERDA